MNTHKTLEKSHGSVQDTNKLNYGNIEIDHEKNTELLEYTEVKNTPFTIAKWENGYYVLMGKHRLTEKLDTKEEAEEDANRTDWDRLIQVVAIITDIKK